MNIFERQKAQRLIQNINQAAAKKNLKEVDRLLKEKNAFIKTLGQKDQVEFKKQSDKLDTQFAKLDGAMNAFLGKENADPEVDKLMRKEQQKAAKKSLNMPQAPTHTPTKPVATPPRIKAGDLPTAPTTPVVTKEYQELMDEFDAGEPETKTAKQELEEMLSGEFQEEMEQIFNDDKNQAEELTKKLIDEFEVDEEDWEKEMEEHNEEEKKHKP